MRQYALERIAGLLVRLTVEVERSKTARDEEAVHDLRVTIRRFARSLQVFAQFVPRRPAKQIRKRLRHIMDLTAEVRNRDITILLLKEHGIDGPVEDLMRDRKLSVRILVSELERWQVEHDEIRWRASLELPSQ